MTEIEILLHSEPLKSRKNAVLTDFLLRDRGSFQMKWHTSRQAKSPIWLKIGYVVLMTHTNKKWKTWFLIFGPQEGFTGLRNCRFYPKMLPIGPTLRALTFLFLKIIEKFQLWVKEGKKCKKKFFGHFRVGQIFFVENQKIEIKLQK